MRHHYLRFDIWICLLLGFLISLGTSKVSEIFIAKKYDSYEKEHIVEAGNIGGIADTSFFRAQTIEDLLSHETFTVISPGIEYRNKGGGYHNNHYLQALTLPSGERVAALINEDAVQHTKDSIYSGDSILPVGRIVYEDLSKDTYFIGQIEYKEPLTRKDFYIDMLGNGGKLREEDYVGTSVLVVQLLTIIISFALFHTLGSKIGVFPAFFSVKKENESEWK